MPLGLKRGTVRLEAHDPAWDEAARLAIAALREVLGEDVADVQHVGSTAIPAIDAKPIVDIAVAVRSLEAAARHDDQLERRGILFRRTERDDDRLYVMGGDASRSHHIHMVPANGEKWKNYIAFRDYLNANPDAAQRYGALKRSLAERYADDRERYTQGKESLIGRLLAEAREWAQSGSN